PPTPPAVTSTASVFSWYGVPNQPNDRITQRFGLRVPVETDDAGGHSADPDRGTISAGPLRASPDASAAGCTAVSASAPCAVVAVDTAPVWPLTDDTGAAGLVSTHAPGSPTHRFS